jgi:hypothetical protein
MIREIFWFSGWAASHSAGRSTENRPWGSVCRVPALAVVRASVPAKVARRRDRISMSGASMIVERWR